MPEVNPTLSYEPNIAKEISKPLIDIQQRLARHHLRVHVTQTTVKLEDKQNTIGPITLSFVDSWQQKHQSWTKNKQPLLRSLNIKRETNVHVADLTAGFGQDSLIIASRGITLTSIEKNPITAAILKTLVLQFKKNVTSCQWQVVNACSQEWLSEQQPNTMTHLIMDPFFEKKTNALPKKSMQWLQLLDQHCEASSETDLFTLAMQQTDCRIIVKRDRKARPIANAKPNQGCIMQKTTRFDCYKT